jgi:hypothetical protein
LKWSHGGSDFLPGGSSEDIVVLELMVMQWRLQEKRREESGDE